LVIGYGHWSFVLHFLTKPWFWAVLSLTWHRDGPPAIGPAEARRRHLRRYHNTKQPGRREQVSFVLTREALAKLVEDLAG
jgi:hypothetical protein